MKTANSKPGDISQSDKGPVVRISNGSLYINGQIIWQNVNLEVNPGEFIAILGPNGSGKSSLVKAILGLIQLNSGTIEVFGKPARRGNSDVGYVPQRRSFDNSVRVRGRDIVRLGLDGGDWGLPFFNPKKSIIYGKQVQKILEKVGATAYADRPIGEMSGGQQQRLLVAQALVTNPRMLVLDEPMESLDIANQRAIAEIIREISMQTGSAVLLVAHDINPIMGSIDRVVYIAKGHVAVGTPAEVITSETLSKLYESPVEVLQSCDGGLVVVGHPGEECISYHDHR